MTTNIIPFPGTRVCSECGVRYSRRYMANLSHPSACECLANHTSDLPPAA